MIFAPINVAAFMYTPAHLRGAAVGLFACCATKGAASARRLRQDDPGTPRAVPSGAVGRASRSVQSGLEQRGAQLQSVFTRQTGDPVTARRMAWQVLSNLREQQASSLAFFDVFWVAAVVALTLVFLVFLMRRSVAERGAHVGGE